MRRLVSAVYKLLRNLIYQLFNFSRIFNTNNLQTITCVNKSNRYRCIVPWLQKHKPRNWYRKFQIYFSCWRNEQIFRNNMRELTKTFVQYETVVLLKSYGVEFIAETLDAKIMCEFLVFRLNGKEFLSNINTMCRCTVQNNWKELPIDRVDHWICCFHERNQPSTFFTWVIRDGISFIRRNILSTLSTQAHFYIPSSTTNLVFVCFTKQNTYFKRKQQVSSW